MSNSIIKCPIPSSQQPLNEYQFLRKACFFSWPTLKFSKFLLKLLLFWIFVSILIIPIVISSCFTIQVFGKLLILDTTFSNLILITLLVRLYLGWSYVMQRLLSATVFYEESGWYDEQMWVKSSHVLAQDRLIGIYQVIPLLKAIKKVLVVVVFVFFIEVFAYYNI